MLHSVARAGVAKLPGSPGLWVRDVINRENFLQFSPRLSPIASFSPHFKLLAGRWSLVLSTFIHVCNTT
jgi:hypothetical protein